MLNCPCGQVDYVGQSELTFAKALARKRGLFCSLCLSFGHESRFAGHREEGNRIMREFLMGEINCQYLTHGMKSEEYCVPLAPTHSLTFPFTLLRKQANDRLWLYQHSARCSVAM